MDLATPAALDNPFPLFQRYRRECPIRFEPKLNAWFIFGHDDITALSREERLSNQRMDLFTNSAPPHLRTDLDFLEKDLSDMVVMLDGTEHRHIRQVMQQGFSGTAIQRLHDRLVFHVEALLDKAAGLPAFDASTQVCRMLPMLALADVVGLPQEDFPRMLGWANAFVQYFNRIPAPEAQTLGLIRAGRELIAYTRALIAQRRITPGTDFISTLVGADIEGEKLTDDQVLGSVVILFIAGTDTVGSGLGNAVWLLLTHPEELAKLSSGAGSWADGFEEVMRYEPANPSVVRKVTETFDYKGHRIEPGQLVFFALASANRDEGHFTDPEIFNVSRSPNRNMGFGVGGHYCLGAMLARAQAAILLPRLFARFPNLQLDPAHPPTWLRTFGVRGPVTLPVIAGADVASKDGL